jgi:hypothetical protein
LHFAVAPLGSVLLAVAVGADLVAVEVLAAVVDALADAGVCTGTVAGDAAAGAAGAAAVAGAAVEAFCTPPWPLQVPLPLEVVVVPSLQFVTPAAGDGVCTGTVAGVAAAGAGAVAAAALDVEAFTWPP